MTVYKLQQSHFTCFFIYFDIRNGEVTNDPSKAYIAILPEGYTIDMMGGASAYQNRLKEWQNRSRRNRDLAIAVTAIVYALTLVDAYVDAQLFDFDISTNLSLNVQPQLYYDLQNQRSAEVKLAILFWKWNNFSTYFCLPS